MNNHLIKPKQWENEKREITKKKLWKKSHIKHFQ